MTWNAFLFWMCYHAEHGTFIAVVASGTSTPPYQAGIEKLTEVNKSNGVSMGDVLTVESVKLGVVEMSDADHNAIRAWLVRYDNSVTHLPYSGGGNIRPFEPERSILEEEQRDNGI